MRIPERDGFYKDLKTGKRVYIQNFHRGLTTESWVVYGEMGQMKVQAENIGVFDKRYKRVYNG